MTARIVRVTKDHLRVALEAAGFEPDGNVCAGCKHGGGDHDLGNHCLICGDYFASMTNDQQWEHGLTLVRAALAAPGEVALNVGRANNWFAAYRKWINGPRLGDPTPMTAFRDGYRLAATPIAPAGDPTSAGDASDAT